MSDCTDALNRLVAAVEAGDAVAYASLFAEGATTLHPLSPDPITGREAIREAEQELFNAFSEVKIDVRAVAVEETRCAAEVVLRAVNSGPLDIGSGEPLPPTGRAIELAATWWLDVGENGLIVSERDYFDTAAFMAQLGFDNQ